MSDPADPLPQPRVEVHLPDGRTVPGRLQRWRQGEDGRWWAEVTVPVPAAAIGRVAGEDYTNVPREPSVPRARYVLEADTRRPNAGSTVHDADCWTLADKAPWTRLMPLDGHAARGQLGFDGTTACTVCNPEP
jgi:hypothetical protein